MASKKVGIHGTDGETGRGKSGGNKTAALGITRAQFSEHAKPLRILIAGPNTGPAEEGKEEYRTVRLIAGVKRNKETGEIGFETGSLGWNNSDKVDVVIDGVMLKVQIGINLTVVGSKELPKD